jgi:hypothetical protein
LVHSEILCEEAHQILFGHCYSFVSYPVILQVRVMDPVFVCIACISVQKTEYYTLYIRYKSYQFESIIYVPFCGIILLVHIALC